MKIFEIEKNLAEAMGLNIVFTEKFIRLYRDDRRHPIWYAGELLAEIHSNKSDKTLYIGGSINTPVYFSTDFGEILVNGNSDMFDKYATVKNDAELITGINNGKVRIATETIEFDAFTVEHISPEKAKAVHLGYAIEGDMPMSIFTIIEQFIAKADIVLNR
ncbi:MAG: hypothetical protein PUF72_09555 [Clostridiales bacterium]|nr:hypothetical protein [Clostridiales bacterium]